MKFGNLLAMGLGLAAFASQVNATVDAFMPSFMGKGHPKEWLLPGQKKHDCTDWHCSSRHDEWSFASAPTSRS